MVPAFTFVGTVNAIRYCSAIPHFVDSSIEKLGIDVDKLKDYLKTITFKKEVLLIIKILEKNKSYHPSPCFWSSMPDRQNFEFSKKI